MIASKDVYDFMYITWIEDKVTRSFLPVCQLVLVFPYQCCCKCFQCPPALKKMAFNISLSNDIWSRNKCMSRNAIKGISKVSGEPNWIFKTENTTVIHGFNVDTDYIHLNLKQCCPHMCTIKRWNVHTSLLPNVGPLVWICP